METGEYETNTLVIVILPSSRWFLPANWTEQNNIASITFRVYVPAPTQSQTFPSVALDVEAALRDEGNIAWYDTSRRAIWLFRINIKDNNDGLSDTGPKATLEAAGFTLQSAEEGHLEPANLSKNTRQAGPSSYTPTSSTSSNSAIEQQQRSALISTPQTTSTTSNDQDVKATGTGAESKPGQANQKLAYENFITAILLTVSVAFCRATDALPLNYRTVLLPTDVGLCDEFDPGWADRNLIIGCFRGYLTTTGALLISLRVSHCKGLHCLGSTLAKQTYPAQTILAAPFGLLSHEQPHYNSDTGSASLANTPNPQALSVRPAVDLPHSLWRQTCLKVLRLRGVNGPLLKDCSWVSLSIPKNRSYEHRHDIKEGQGLTALAAVPWPAMLCFRKKTLEITSTNLIGQTMLSGHEENHDPLGDAGGWHNTSEEREERVSKRKTDRTLTIAKEANEPDIGSRRAGGQSPLALRRPSTATAITGTMYPTPPDGIQQFNGVTPSLDDTISSPMNAAPTSAVADTEAIVHTDSANEDFNTSNESDLTESRRDRSDSNLLNDAENMFGDMGGDMFGDNDITEADFNFFDEQPEDEAFDIPMVDPPLPEPPKEIPQAPLSLESSPIPVIGNAPPASTESSPVVFAKPELKHARSSLNDNSASKKPAGRNVTSSKRESSPFNPQTVYKRVRSSLATGLALQSAPISFDNKAKTFGRIDLGTSLPVINKKYEQGGMFDFNKATHAEKLKPGQRLVPETDYLKRHGKHNTDQKARLLAVGALVRGITELEVPSSHPSPQKLDIQASDGDDNSVESDLDDASSTQDEPGSPLKPHLKSGTVEDDVASHVTSVRDNDFLDEPEQQLVTELPRAFKPDTVEHSIANFFAEPEPLAAESGLSDNDLIQIAQLLTEQVATGNLEICGLHHDEAMQPVTRMKQQILANSARKSINTLEGIVPSILGGASSLRLKALLDVQDIAHIAQPNRLQPRPVPGRDSNPEQLRPSNLYQIPGPHLEVRRAETRLSILPSAIGFWESLGLAPSSGTKDVRAICVFPGWKGMAENAGTFLDRMKSIYELLKLGGFENVPLPGDLQEGILPYEVDRISTSPDSMTTGSSSALIESIETLRGAISDLTVMETNVVIYFVYSPGNPRTVIEACTAFQRLFESYQKQLAMRRETPQNDLVLQLISMDFLSSPNTLVIPSPADLMRVCLETYDRCTLFNGPMPAPAIRLEQPLPRSIDFKLSNTPSASLMQENSCIHVAYAQSLDERWVTAAWTDDRGNQQATASYCLARRGKPISTSMDEIAHEVWESTLELIASCKVHWRVIITKCSPMGQHEIEFWLDLARTEIKASVSLTLTTVDTAPSLQLIPPLINLAPTTTAFYTTPVSTPQANIVSPEQIATPATPMRDANNAGAATPGAESTAEAESDSVLVDVTDQTWGAIVGHRLGNPAPMMETQPALLTGYLIKRTGNKMEDTPTVMEVNLIHADSVPRAYENLMRETLSNFRGLGTLARARGVVDRDVDIRPWHVAAAEKAVRALYLLM
ncbi:Mediator of RNA polymerase II transcription subunit 13 [Paramyrothecium foliicola]|nr:Mediator of RNA polymerase II transcription subunit 13 [Paramyrothecium foliicola]